MLQEFLYNFSHNLFKPLLMFFYAGFLIPILGVKFEFPKAIYKGLTIYLLLAIGWHGGEELAALKASEFGHAFGFMLVGLATNLCIGILAFVTLRKCTKLRHVDAATVAGYYGSDSAGTFVTALGVLTASNIAFAAYMPVMLAVMEIPGCLLALFIVSKLRARGLNAAGFMPGEAGHVATAPARRLPVVADVQEHAESDDEEEEPAWHDEMDSDAELVAVGADVAESETTSHSSSHSSTTSRNGRASRHSNGQSHSDGPANSNGGLSDDELTEMLELQSTLTLESEAEAIPAAEPAAGPFSAKLLHEVFFNPGIYLLFAGITIGFISRLQGEKVIAANDFVFVNMFQGLLCLFLLEMGMTASARLRDLKRAGWQFIAFGLLAPNVFAAIGIGMAHAYGTLIGQQFDLGTYVLFAVLCGSASYIALPAVQRMAIPEASPTLPLAASLGLTFSYNVTIGIPVYLLMATALTTYFPVGAL